MEILSFLECTSSSKTVILGIELEEIATSEKSAFSTRCDRNFREDIYQEISVLLFMLT